MHESARNTSSLRKVFDPGLLVSALGEVRVGGVEDSVAPLRGVKATARRWCAHPSDSTELAFCQQAC